MFREIRDLRQERGGGRRRWFESDGLELVVWTGEGGSVDGFQLCYDWGRGEHALTWRPGAGFAHNEIDSGESSPLKNETPILMPDGAAPWAKLLRHFDACSTTLEPSVRDFVRGRLAGQVGAETSREAV